ncbi:MAG: UbiA-like polyprenyltransferase [Chitinophagaceae bacterium]
MINRIKHYFSLITFSHTIFALPFAIIGFFTAIKMGYLFHGILFVYVILGMFFARSAAMAFNRWIDADIDKLNPRTCNREIPKGIFRKSEVCSVIIANCIAFCIICFFINKLCFYLSFVALFVILSYSYTKRFTFWCHAVLGLGLGLAPIGAFLSVAGVFNIVPIFYGISVLFWVGGFDIIYSIQDVQFDKKQQLYSVPSYFGKSVALWIAKIFHIIATLSLILVYCFWNVGWLYIISVFVFAFCIFCQYVKITKNHFSNINKDFLTFNGWASILLMVGILLDYLLY